MSNFYKTKTSNHDEADVDSFYECGRSLAENVDGDNEEYVVNKIEPKDKEFNASTNDASEVDDRFIMPVSTAEQTILLPEGRRYHFSRRRSMSTSEIMDLELARTFDNVQAMIASYTSKKEDSASEDNTPLSTPRASPKLSHKGPDSNKIERNLSQRRQRSPSGNPVLSVAARDNQLVSSKSPVIMRKRAVYQERSVRLKGSPSTTSPSMKRSSILVHENEDVLNLADEVHFREMFLVNRSKDSTPNSSRSNLGPDAVSQGPETDESKEDLLKSSVSVRRNSSGYSTSSGGSTISSASNKDVVETKNEGGKKESKTVTTSSLLVVRKGDRSSNRDISNSSLESRCPNSKSPVVDGKTSASSILVSYSGSNKKLVSESLSTQPEMRNHGKRSVSPRNPTRFRTVPGGDEPQEIKQFQKAFTKNRRASVCAANVHTNQKFIQDYNNSSQGKHEKETPSPKTSVGHRLSNIFTTKHRESPSAKKIERKIAMERQKSHEQQQNVRHNAFVQTRSKTGINSFFSGRRRQSIAITDDAYNSALRAAKSHYDLSMLVSQPSKGKDTKTDERQKRDSSLGRQGSQPTTPVKSPSAIPLHLQTPSVLGPASACLTPTTRMKFGLKDRPWTELERLWKGKLKDPPGPNIESMVKPHVTFASDRRGNETRALTLPIEPADVKEAERSLRETSSHRSLTASDSLPNATPKNKQKGESEKHLRSKTIKGYPPRQNLNIDLSTTKTSSSTSITGSGLHASDKIDTPANVVVATPSQNIHHRRTPSGGLISNWIASHTSDNHFHSPFVVRKAVDLLAPNVINDWQIQRGYYRGTSVPPEQVEATQNKDDRPQHFRELLDHW